MISTSLVDIHKDIIEKTLRNPYAYHLVHMQDFSCHESIYHYSSYKKITLEELAPIYGFNEDIVANILYCREIKKRCSAMFEKIKKEIIHPKKQLITVFKVPGEVLGEKKTFVLFFPSYFGNDFNYPVVKYLEEKGFAGCTIVRIPPVGGYGLGHMLYRQIKSGKIDAILNFYANGASENCWSDFEYQICHDLKEPMQSELKEMFKIIPKNHKNRDSSGGFDLEEVHRLLQRL